MVKRKTNRFLKAGLRLLGSIPSVGRTVKKKTTKVASKLKSMKKKASAKNKKKDQKKLKKKGIFAIGKVVTKARKIKNNLSKNESIQKLKLAMKGGVLAAKVTKIEANSSKDQNGFIKSANSLKEIVQDGFSNAYSAASNRNKNKFNTLYDFGNWITFGTPDTVKGAYHVLKDRSAKKEILCLIV